MLEHERIREAPCGCRTDGPTGLTTAWCPAHAPFPTLYEAEAAFRREYVLRALAHAAGNRTRAAQLLGINRTSLLRFLRERISLDTPEALELQSQHGAATRAHKAQ